MIDFSVSIEMMFDENDRPFDDRVRAAADAGFPAVEIWDWADKDLPRLDRALQQTGTEMHTLCVESWREKRQLADPASHDPYLRRVREAAYAARRLNAPKLVVLAGGRTPGHRHRCAETSCGRRALPRRGCRRRRRHRARRRGSPSSMGRPERAAGELESRSRRRAERQPPEREVPLRPVPRHPQRRSARAGRRGRHAADRARAWRPMSPDATSSAPAPSIGPPNSRGSTETDTPATSGSRDQRSETRAASMPMHERSSAERGPGLVCS